MKAFTTRARKLGLIGLAFICLIIGLITVWTPLPTGVPLLAAGIVILVSISPTARRLVRRARMNSSPLDRGVAFIEARAHRSMATMLKRTRPLARKIEAKGAIAAANKALASSRARKATPRRSH
ncbi:hypothetical protein RDV64_02645 [Acuticoccus sp. MNP-M23]|uniref:hypothetical protein n=1 Tax=Acuticoccus sp. MNP-M23 TaxID=3072793 RepID=UPI002814D2F9|nr:hypothetical protein [Acuticoccus sp. MNP-M23]WMS43320.1 hypothetical protein RDV64_02645 [Acuticoccus sp. MNP-M23]